MAVLSKNGYEVLRFERSIKTQSRFVEGDWIDGKTVLSIRSNGWILKNSIRKYRSQYSTRKDGCEVIRLGWKRYKRLKSNVDLTHNLEASAKNQENLVTHFTELGFTLK